MQVGKLFRWLSSRLKFGDSLKLQTEKVSGLKCQSDLWNKLWTLIIYFKKWEQLNSVTSLTEVKILVNEIVQIQSKCNKPNFEIFSQNYGRFLYVT